MKIAVIGTGHMGSWFVNELGSDHEVAVFDTDPAKTASLKQVRILEEITGLRDFAPSLLINAVSIRNTIPVYRNVAGIIPSDCVICDVASVKGELEDYYRTCGFEFVSLHPMFGPTFANINDLQEENVIIIKESSVKAVRFFRELFEKRQLNIFEFSFAEHDRMIAYSLTLPFASTLVFAACMDNTAVPGTTFKKHKAIAKGLLSEDDNLLSDILFNKHSFKELEKVTSRLEFLKHVIKGRDYEEASRFFSKLRDNIA